MSNRNELAQEIVNKAKENYYSIVQIAKILEIDTSTVHKKLNGTNKWRKCELNELCRYFNLPYGYFESFKE